MKKFIKEIYYVVLNFKKYFYNIYNFKYNYEQRLRVAPWVMIKEDNTLRLDYNCLDENSLVFDIGGYEGNWSSDIFSKYLCNIFIYEPVEKFSNEIILRFKKNNKIKVYGFGLGKNDQELEISIDNNSSSVFKGGQVKEKVKIKDISNFINENKIEKIDLMKINIEGGEYDLLESLINNNLIKIVKNIQVQFHDFVPNAENLMKSIQKELQKTHELTYQYKFVWENWKLKE